VIGVVEIGQLVEVIWVSVLAGVGITAAFSFVVLGTGRSAEARRAGRSGAAMAYGAFALLFLLVFAAAIVIGVQIMLSKSA
jgi:hypothetical protein